MLEKYLQEIGLTDKEAAVYLALLQVDTISVMDLAKKANINRSTTYFILESLKRKGLVSETTMGKKTTYQAAPPERLETYVESQKSVFDERLKRVKEIIPQIKSIERDNGQRPVVKYFEGWEGVISANEELLNEEPDGSPLYNIFPKDLLNEVLSEESLAKLRAKRLARNVQTRTLYTYENKEIPPHPSFEAIKLDGTHPLYCDISIYKSSIRISILGKKISGIFVKSKELADTLKSLFEIISEIKKK